MTGGVARLGAGPGAWGSRGGAAGSGLGPAQRSAARRVAVGGGAVRRNPAEPEPPPRALGVGWGWGGRINT